MKYILGLGFFLKEKYKSHPLVRVFLDDKFIDEFYITENLKARKKWLSDPSHWIYQSKKNWIWHNRLDGGYRGLKSSPISQPRLLDRLDIDFPKQFKCYIIDEEVLKKSTKLICEIRNDDTNYTNGFMTKSTVIDVSKIFLLPCRYVDFFKKKEQQDLRQEFNNKIVHPMYCYNGNTLERNYQLIHTRLPWASVHLPTNQNYTEGYPFQFRCFWNDNICPWPENVGGSGVLTVDIKQNQHGCITFDHPNMEHTGLYDEKLSQWGFPISEKFFSIAETIDVHKY